MNDARAIANYILDEFDSLENGISNKKINKLIYFCHGFSLLRIESPLVKNHIEAWEHGPVVKVVYDAFKQFDHRPIMNRAKAFNYSSGIDEVVNYDSVSKEQLVLTKSVSQHYMKFSANELEEMSHSHFGPWAKVWNTPEAQRGLRSRIPDFSIRNHFVEMHGETPLIH